MKRVTALGLSVLLAGFFSCGKHIEKSQYEDIQNQLHEIRRQLGEVQRRLDKEGGGKYAIFQSGFRTWRLNSATGETCILLTTDADWKNGEAQAQSCDCKEFMAGGLIESERLKREDKQQWEQWRQVFCGNGNARAMRPAGAIAQPLR